MKIGVMKQVEVDVTTVRVHVKVRDEGFYTFLDQDGEGFDVCAGYVPSFFPGDHNGDYLILDIDLETGVIKNWQKPTVHDLKEYLENN